MTADDGCRHGGVALARPNDCAHAGRTARILKRAYAFRTTREKFVKKRKFRRFRELNETSTNCRTRNRRVLLLSLKRAYSRLQHCFKGIQDWIVAFGRIQRCIARNIPQIWLKKGEKRNSRNRSTVSEISLRLYYPCLKNNKNILERLEINLHSI